MIYHVKALKVAGPGDLERVRSILKDPSVEGTFGELTVNGEPWEGAFGDLLWFIAPGIVFAAEVRKDFTVYAHVAVLPWARGKPAMDAARELIVWLFKNTPCQKIAGYTPVGLIHAKAFNRLLGFQAKATRKGRTLFVLSKEDFK